MIGAKGITIVRFTPSGAQLIADACATGHCKHRNENTQARLIAEQASSVSPQASRRHLSATAGAGREWRMMAEPNAVGYLRGGPSPAQNDPERTAGIPDYGLSAWCFADCR
ncbi:hypothetical protein [Burkholderia lata]|uniref:hypothetical protein n=1 Tax=Burkholderia lata (strain ATCC 17760 / DSM 23089 / LMG 22485 / NCIMB 9086 / R18194 / 383) TaxID=482957 RepID=UPI0012FE44B7|nr:hypothetical protein [Burkholderia lata]